jgi:hypothetical protein
MLINSSILSNTVWYNVIRSSRVNVSPDLPWSLTVLNPITENGLLMGSQATVRDCSMLGIAVYYTKDILPNILYNCSGYYRFGIKPRYPLLIRIIAGWYGVFAISNYNSRGVWLKIWGNKVTLRHLAINAGSVSNEMRHCLFLWSSIIKYAFCLTPGGYRYSTGTILEKDAYFSSLMDRHTSRLKFCKLIKYTLYYQLSPVVEFSHGAFFC